MTLPLLSNTATYGLWWQETNQMIGIINNLTDGQLIVNGSIVFTNSQFSLSSPSQNISNTLALTSATGNSLFLLSSNAVINGTVFLTGPNSGLAVSNNANINQNLYVAGNTYSGNLNVYQTTLANTLIANTIIVANEIITTSLVTSNANVTTHNSNSISTQNISIQTANVSQGIGIVGGLTADFANLNFMTSNNVVQIYSNPSINTAGQISSTLFQGTGIAQFRAVQGSAGVIFRNDGTNFSILTTGNVPNPYTANFTSFIPFQFNVSTGAVTLDATGVGVTFGGPLIMQGTAQHSNTLSVTGLVSANGPGLSLYVANTTFLNGSVTANNQFTVNQSAFYNGSVFFNNGINVTGQAIFVTQVTLQSTFSVSQASTFFGSVTVSNILNVTQLITASAPQIGIVSSTGEIQSTASVTSSSLPFAQFRAVQGNYGVLLRNDGTNMSFLQTPSTTQPTSSTWNSFRPLGWSLSSGVVTIDGGGSGTIMGGNLAVAGAFNSGGITSSGGITASAGISGSSLNITGVATIASLSIAGGALSVSGLLSSGTGLNITGGASITGNLGVGGALTLSGGLTLQNGLFITGITSITGSLTVSTTGSFSGSLTVGGVTTINNNLTCQGFTSTGAATHQSTLNVVGTGTFNNLNINGTGTINVLSVNGTFNTGSAQATIGGGLNVLGPTIIQNNFAISGGFDCQGALTVQGIFGVSSTAQANFAGIIEVTGANTTATSGAYFLGTSTTALGTFSGTIAYSLYAPNGYYFGVGFFAGSDIRLKSNVVPISPEEGKDFVTVSNPVTFIKHETIGAGFIAQEQIKAGYGKFVNAVPYEGLKELIEEDGCISAEGMALGLEYDNYIAYLVAFGKWSVDKIEQLEKRIKVLEGMY